MGLMINGKMGTLHGWSSTYQGPNESETITCGGFGPG